MSNHVYNSKDLWSIEDAAISTGLSTWQPRVNKGAALNLGANTASFDNVAFGADDVTTSNGYPGPTGTTRQQLITAGDYASMTPGHYVMIRGGSNTNYIAGVSSGVLRQSDNGEVRGIKDRLHIRSVKTATAIRAGLWNIYSGVFSTAPGTGIDGTWDIDAGAIDTNGDADVEANPSQSSPGGLVYKTSAANPTSDTYEGRSIW